MTAEFAALAANPLAVVVTHVRAHLERQAQLLSKAGALPDAGGTVARLFDPAINQQFNKAIAEAVA